MRLMTLTLCAALATTGCARIADSRLNPLNWFNRVTETRAPAVQRPLLLPGEGVQIIEARPLIAEITELRIERASEGAIVRATGLAHATGAFNAQLTREGVENGVLVYGFRAEYAPNSQVAAPSNLRQITAAATLDAGDLAQIRAVRVVTEANALTASR